MSINAWWCWVCLWYVLGWRCISVWIVRHTHREPTSNWLSNRLSFTPISVVETMDVVS